MNNTRSTVRRVVLDVLKPHEPNILDFATAIAEQHSGCSVTVTVIEMDEKTESTELVIEGDAIVYDTLVNAINRLGATVHSIDAVEVCSTDITDTHAY